MKNMTKKTLVTLIFMAFYGLQSTSAQAKMDCAALKKEIDNAFKNSTSIRIGYSSYGRNLYLEYEQDAQSSSRLSVKNTGKKPTQQMLISVKNKQYFAKDKIDVPNSVLKWVDKIPTDFNSIAWIDSCKSASSVFLLPYTKCFLSEEKMITGTPYSLYSVDVANDTFDVCINKTTNKLEKIEGRNKLKNLRFEWYFDNPFTITEPPAIAEDNPEYGFKMFPPLFSYDKFDGTERVYSIVDKNAEHRGGQRNMFMFMAQNIRYPAKSREANIQGTIYIGFVVEKNGVLTNFKLKRGISEDCDAEAMRVLKLMSGNWEAGVLNGQKVRQAFTIPVKFKLE
jgi:TonB family protein